MQNIPADKVVVPIPADFVMAESVHQLMSELTALVYKHGECCLHRRPSWRGPQHAKGFMLCMLCPVYDKVA